MAQVVIPFHDSFQDKMLNGWKTCTSRFRRYGSVGDEFEAFEARFRLISLSKHTIGYVSTCLFAREGFNSPEEFISFWRLIHPKRDMEHLVVWVHEFECIKPPEQCLGGVRFFESQERLPLGLSAFRLRLPPSLHQPRQDKSRGHRGDDPQ